MKFAAFWNKLIARLPTPHFLQTWQWAQVKARYGWQPIYLLWDDAQCRVLSNPSPEHHEAWRDEQKIQAAALVLKKSVISGGMAARLSLLYCPKGPNLDWENAPLRKRVLHDLERFARQQGGIFMKLDPDVVLASGLPGTENETPNPGGESVLTEFRQRGWQFSAEQIQFRNTVLLDVSLSEEEMLARMKQKTRYNLRLAAKKGVNVRLGTPADWPMLYKMYAETSVRDGFVIRDEGYYQTVWKMFQPPNAHLSPEIPLAEPLIAEVEGEAVAAVFLFAFAGRAYYVYGMSREAHREKMPNYLLQWHAMQWAKAHGCQVYDLWGAPDVFSESDPLWGVFRFKEGLGGQVVQTMGAWDYIPNPLWYTLYTRIMPTVLNWMRARGKIKTQRQVEA
ncbi:MAG: hypothetical protein DDG60_05120 [Anaerolineae bacterium]|nr:MAG: hypothetical protein DDG60_05120 [Anaerolineae bacterium]